MFEDAYKTSNTLAAIRELTPEIARRADEIEKHQAVPADLMEKLRQAGMFRMMLPRAYGGSELHLLQVSRVLEELARVDASVAWNGMVSVGWNKFIAYFPRETHAALFAKSPDVLIKGAIAPKGTVVATDGGYIVKGRWPLASGSFKPQWAFGNCLVVDSEGKPQIGQKGIPQMRAVLVPAEKATFLDTWDSVGLRASESDDFVLEEQFVEEAYTADIFGAPTFEPRVHRLAGDMFTSPTHGSVAIGIAQGALGDFTELARNKRPSFGGGKRMAEDLVLASRVGELAIRLGALRAYLEQLIVEAWEMAQSGDVIPSRKRVESASMAAYVQHEASDIVNELFSMSGATPCYNSSLLQRRWRDIRCVAQHIAASTASYQLLGSDLMGEDVGRMLL